MFVSLAQSLSQGVALHWLVIWLYGFQVFQGLFSTLRLSFPRIVLVCAGRKKQITLDFSCAKRITPMRTIGYTG